MVRGRVDRTVQAMRAIWKGAVSFGLVSIGVKMYSATEERDVSFHQVRRSDGSRIRYRRVAEADGEEVAYSDIAKGYSLPSGETIVLTDEDLADLPLATRGSSTSCNLFLQSRWILSTSREATTWSRKTRQ